MKIGDYEVHEYAIPFPMMTGIPYEILRDDIKASGLLIPIVLTKDGLLLDGRNRYRACLETNAKPAFVTYDGPDPLRFVASVNLARRHLEDGQRAVIASELAALSHGGDRKSSRKSATRTPTLDEAAEAMHVSPRSVSTAREIKEKAEPEIYEAVKAGDLSLNAGAELARQPKAEQRAAIARDFAPADRPTPDASPTSIVRLFTAMLGAIKGCGANVKHVNTNSESAELRIALDGHVFRLELRVES